MVRAEAETRYETGALGGGQAGEQGALCCHLVLAGPPGGELCWQTWSSGEG